MTPLQHVAGAGSNLDERACVDPRRDCFTPVQPLAVRFVRWRKKKRKLQQWCVRVVEDVVSRGQ